MNKFFNKGLFRYKRRKSHTVNIGDSGIGGNNPIRIQSMTTTDTMDTKSTVDQTIRMVNSGCEFVRITAPSVGAAKNLSNIKATKRNDDILTLAIELVRAGSSKEEIKSKTGLNDSEIETIYAYHKNVNN